MNWILAILMCVPPLFTATGKHVVKTKTRYLVSEAWCVNCPAVKTRFVANGWPEKNVITIAECEQLFGWKPPHVPYEFIEPTKTVTRTRTVSEQASVPRTTTTTRSTRKWRR